MQELGSARQAEEQLYLLNSRVESGFEVIKSGMDGLYKQMSKLSADVIDAFNNRVVSSIDQSTQGLPERALNRREEMASSQVIQVLKEKEELIHDLYKRIDSLSGELNRRDGELREARMETNKLRQKEATLRNVILDKTGDQRASDEQVRDQFLALRQRIQGIVSGSWLDVEKPPLLPHKTDKEIVSFFDGKSWKQHPAKERTYRVRAKMFENVHRHILCVEYFGLRGYKVNDASVEKGLIHFQLALKDAEVSDSIISDWVTNTIQCAKLLKHHDDVSTKRVSDIMFGFLYPILSSSPKKVEAELKDALHRLCEDAFSLRLAMNLSKEGYASELPPEDGRLSNLENCVEGMGVEGGGKNKDASDHIAYTLFGALTKHPKHRGEEKRYLEKAHVILRSR